MASDRRTTVRIASVRITSVRMRAGGAAGVLQAIAAGGGSPERALAAAELRAAELSDPDRLVELGKVVALFEAGARETGDDLFGAHVGCAYDLAALGAVSYAVLNAPTVGQALRNFERYAHTHIQGARIGPVIEGDECVLVQSFVAARRDLRRQGVECAAAVALQLLRRLIGPAWRPRRVRFGHSAPADPTPHERVFGAPVQFDQAVDAALVFDAADLEREVPGADRKLLPIVQRHLDETSGDGGADDAWLRELRSLVARTVCDGHPNVDKIAPRLGMSPRTLQRRLGAHGLVWKGLVEEVRRELASRYLEGRTPLTEVAFLLGYSELSAFDRAFRRWTGSTPIAHRRRAQDAVAP